MGDRYLLDLADVCRRAGLSVTEVEGWQYRARGSGGYSSGKPDHVMVHHTASPASADGWSDVNYIAEGDEDAPLSNLYLGRSGQVWVIAGGATNTNGSGADPCGHIEPDTMNSSAIGIEAGNDGVGETWPASQLDAYLRLIDALCAAYGVPTARVHGHAEWAPSRKVDPAGPPRYASGADTWNMAAFRDDLGGGQPLPPDPGGDMPAYCVRDVDGWPWVTDWCTSATMVTEDQAARGRDLRGWLVAPDGGPFPIDAQDSDLMRRLSG